MQTDGEVFDASLNDAAPAAQPDASPAPVAPASPSIEDTVRAAFKQHSQPRDEVGRFAQNDSKVSAPVSPAATASPVTDPATQTVDPAAAALTPALALPPSWGQKNADLWAKMPPEAQAFVAQREEQINRGMARYEGVAAYADMAEQSGTTLKEALSRYVQYEQSMEKQPVQTLLNLAHLYGVSRDQLLAAVNATPSQPAPVQAALDPQIARTIQELQSQVHDMRAAPIRQTVQQFFDDPANKYVEDVADDIAAIIQGNPQADLKSAYEQAIWANPKIRAELLKGERDAAEKAAIAARQTHVPTTASRSLSPSPVERGSPAIRKGLTVEETVRAAFRQHA